MMLPLSNRKTKAYFYPNFMASRGRNLVPPDGRRSKTGFTYGHRNSDIATKIRSIRDTRSAIHGLDLETQIGMFHVDCAQLNADLVAQTNELEYRVKTDQLDRNRDLNRQINKDYEEIGHRLDIDIETTSDLGSFSIAHSDLLKYWR